MIVESRYRLPHHVREELERRPVQWGFGPLSEAVYYRTYSRQGPSGQEAWLDTVVRVVEGVMSIREDWLRNVVGKRFNRADADVMAGRLVEAIYTMKMLPPGRGLWAMGTEYVYERGSHALNNCGAIDVTTNLAAAARWLMDSLMCGVGVGFTTHNANLRAFRNPKTSAVDTYKIPDTREGWAESVKRLIQSYERGGRAVVMDYSLVRGAGEPIKGFGGTSAGPGPLKDLHHALEQTLRSFVAGSISQTRLIADVMNLIGTCVVAGNVRRSAEIAIGSVADVDFMNLKDYKIHPEREMIGWMSNNSVALTNAEEFEASIPVMAERIADNGEPGLLNLLNVRKYGRLGEKRPDDAVAINPCGEIPLESAELCNLVEVFPTRCDPAELNEIFELAAFYASTVALLRSHSVDTNEVVSRNRRIGVSVSGIADWLDATSVSHVFAALNRGYDVVREVNRKLARSAGVAESIRVTTVKPSGTVSLLAGVSSGMHFPVAGYVLRRVRVAQDSPVSGLLSRAGVPHERDVVSTGTEVFEFPVRYGSGSRTTRSVSRVSIFEQAAVVAMLQRAWADNAVSNTLTVQPEELRHVERVLSLFAPQVKSMSMLPDRGDAYVQMPVEAITRQQYEDRSSKIKPVRWKAVKDSDGDAYSDAYCADDVCEVPQQ